MGADESLAVIAAKVNSLSAQVERHADRLARVETNYENVVVEIRKINELLLRMTKVISQVRWFAFGAAFWFIATEYGVVEVLKKMM